MTEVFSRRRLAPRWSKTGIRGSGGGRRPLSWRSVFLVAAAVLAGGCLLLALCLHQGLNDHEHASAHIAATRRARQRPSFRPHAASAALGALPPPPPSQRTASDGAPDGAIDASSSLDAAVMMAGWALAATGDGAQPVAKHHHAPPPAAGDGAAADANGATAGDAKQSDAQYARGVFYFAVGPDLAKAFKSAASLRQYTRSWRACSSLDADDDDGRGHVAGSEAAARDEGGRGAPCVHVTIFTDHTGVAEARRFLGRRRARGGGAAGASCTATATTSSTSWRTSSGAQRCLTASRTRAAAPRRARRPRAPRRARR